MSDLLCGKTERGFMKTDLKVSADINAGMDQLGKFLNDLSVKLGIAGKELLPYYAKRVFLRGLQRIIFGALVMILPYLLFFVNPFPETYKDYWMLARILFCITTTWKGLDWITDWIEEIGAPESVAIQWLLDEFRNFIKAVR